MKKYTALLVRELMDRGEALDSFGQYCLSTSRIANTAIYSETYLNRLIKGPTLSARFREVVGLES